METLEQIRDRILKETPQTRLDIMNCGLAGQHALLIHRDDLGKVAGWLRDDSELRLDYCSNVTGIDWLARKEKIKEGDQEIEKEIPGYLEVVYHLYSMAKKHGPVVIRTRTGDRDKDVHVPSLTPIWRGCEFQEREVYDLYGIIFDGHPDLRRILMWDEFQDYPMRKDYVEPDDYEWEPTPHGEVLERARRHYPGNAFQMGPNAR
jgi:NADH-quinone oxidoreductase subunit C